MKLGEPRVGPLARQPPAILRELQPFAHGVRYLSVPSRDRPISDNTVNAALRRLGYSK